MVLTGVGGGMLLVLAIVVPSVLRRGLAPLDAVASQAAGITATSLSARFAVDRLPGELAPMGARLNDLLARLPLKTCVRIQIQAVFQSRAQTPR